MNILIYGAGVIGSIFAARLALSGNKVTVLARGKRYEEIKKEGIILNNYITLKTENAPVEVIDELLPNMEYDYIIVTMQKTHVDDILPALSKNCSKNIVFAVNTAEGYDKWVKAIGKERLMIGFPAVGGKRTNGEVDYFIIKGVKRIFQTTTFGEYSGEKTKRTKSLIKLFNRAGIPSVFCSDMDSWQKTHISLVTNMANALYGYDCNNYKLAKSYRDVKDMVLAIKEGLKVIKKIGIKPTPRKLSFLNLPTPILTIIFSLFIGTSFAEIIMAKHCIKAKDEMILLQGEFDKLIVKSNLKTPTIQKLKSNLFIK